MKNGSPRRYWTRLDDDGRIVEGTAPEVDTEFPVGASEPPDDLSRRTLLKLMGASLALTGTAACRRPVEHIVPYVDYPEGMVPGIPKRYATTLVRGTEAVGVVVEAHEGRPGKIEGNELHPGSHGAAGAQAQAAILDLYDPDRSRQVRYQGDATSFEAFVRSWAEVDLGADGAGLAILSTGYSSPTVARLRSEVEARYPQATWMAWDAIGDGEIFAGTGARPVHHLDRAAVVVALDADLLLTESNAVHHGRGWAVGRSLDRPGGPLRAYVVESALSLTGANADHRVRLQSRQVPALAAALAAALGVPGGEALAGNLPPEVAARARLMAADLRRAGAAGLVVAGRRQPAAVHALTLAMNRALGAVGTTITLHPLTDVGHGDDAGLAGFVETLRSGAVQALVMVGGNPVYDAPSDLGFGEALAQVGTSVHLSPAFDETSRAATWHLPATHFLEAWGDARAADGTASVVQPVIAPLFGGTSEVELLGLLATGAPVSGHDQVRATWLGGLVASEAAWNQVLHDGVLAGSAQTAEPSDPVAAPDFEATDAEGLELVLLPSPSSWDGRQANNAWLQEAPDPVTKLSWDNAAVMSPATASGLGVATGDHVTLQRGESSVTLPALVIPGTAEGTVAVELGYGRSSVGRVGQGVGVDVTPLRESGHGLVAGGLTVRAAGTRGWLVFAQEQWDLEGRNIFREATLEEYRAHPEFAKEPDEHLVDVALWPSPANHEVGPQWGMAIDLNACTGCMACVTACQSENNIPVVGKDQVDRGRDMFWLRVDRYFVGEAAEPEVAFQPVPCMHCEDAPCEQVCPVAATVHDAHGLNLMVYNRCIGTRYCSNNCPYKVRRFNFYNFTKDTPELAKMAMNPDVTVRSRGVMEKCTYCIQRIVGGRRQAAREGRDLADGDIRTACQQTCPTQAITFGDITQPDSAVSRSKGGTRDYTLLAELSNHPRTSYAGKVRNPNPEWA